MQDICDLKSDTTFFFPFFFSRFFFSSKKRMCSRIVRSFIEPSSFSRIRNFSTFQSIPISEENVSFLKTSHLQNQFFHFQQQHDASVLEEFEKIQKEKQQTTKDFVRQVRRCSKLRVKQLKVLSENPPEMVPTILDSYDQTSNLNSIVSAAQRWGYDPSSRITNDFFRLSLLRSFQEHDHAMKKNRGRKANTKKGDLDFERIVNPDFFDNMEVHPTENPQSSHSIEHFVHANMNRLRYYEQIYDLCAEHYAHFGSIRNFEKMSHYPDKKKLEKIGIMDFDPVTWMASKQRRWEAVAGILQEELRKMGLDAACPSFPLYPRDIPVVFPLRFGGERRMVPFDIPHKAPKVYFDMMRDRIHVSSKERNNPAPQPKKVVKITRQFHIEPAYKKSFRKMAALETRKVVMKLKLADLNLPPIVRERFLALVGPRYDPETDILKLVGNKYQNKRLNSVYLKQVMKELLNESFLASPHYVPPSESSELSLLPAPYSLPEVNPDQELVVFRFVPPLSL